MAPVSDQYRITHTTGRARAGHERGGVLAHLVDTTTWVALCGARPRRLSSWSEYDDPAITCEKCAHEAGELGIEPPAPWWADDELDMMGQWFAVAGVGGGGDGLY